MEYLEPDPTSAGELYKSWLLTEKAKKLVGKRGGQCVVFVRNFLDVDRDVVWGYAKVEINSQEPEIGAIGKTKGHVFVILSIEGDTLTIADSNYRYDERVRIRTININDPRILGYRIIND